MNRPLSSLLTVIFAALCLASCASGPAPELPSGTAAYEIVPVGDVVAPRRSEIGPNDVLSISVFREPDLSLDRAIVDSNGEVQIPLLGSVPASGQTAADFARNLERKFGVRYLVNPSVTVAITEAALSRVTVTGAVTKPGVYDMPSRISLVDAVALAAGPTNVAKFDSVVVFRRLNGQRVGALFNLGEINAGAADDVEILPGDQVIVGTDSMKQLYRDVLTTAPLLSIFRPF